MLSILITCIVTAGLTTAGHRVYYKLKPRFVKTALTAADWGLRPTLDGEAWKEFYRCIKEECKGWKLTHAMVHSLFENGFRFSCAQIYELAETCQSRFKGDNNGIKDLLMYELTVAGEAQEKVQRLLFAADEHYLLTGRTS